MRQIELLRLVIRVLERLEVSYAIVGSYASGAWGEPRMTRDIDIVIQPSTRQVGALCDAFSDDDFYVSREAAEDAQRRLGQFNLIHPSSGNKVDFMVVGEGGWASAQLARRQQIQFDAETVGYIASPEDIIIGKLLYYKEGGSEKHTRDIVGILKAAERDVDRPYVAKFAAQLGVAELWEAILARVDGTGRTEPRD